MSAGGSPASWLQGMDSNHRFPAYEAGEIGHFSTLRRWRAQQDSNLQTSTFARLRSIQLSYGRAVSEDYSIVSPDYFVVWPCPVFRSWPRPSTTGHRQCPCRHRLQVRP